MLELRPTCEHCNKPLPPDSLEAMICTFECTFCKDCVTDLLEEVCPNCGGNFVPRPIRPSQNRKGGNDLGNHPAGTRVVWKNVDFESHRVLVEEVKGIPPHQR